MVESTALAVRTQSAPAVIAPSSFAELIDLADRIAKSTLLPEALRNKPADVLMQIMAGQELGLHAMVSLSSFDIMPGGKPTINARTAVALVLSSGKCEYFRRVGEGTSTSVTYATKRKGEPEQRCTWTWEMAKTAALHQKDNYRCYPRAMLASRAKSELANDVYPDVLKGIAIREDFDTPFNRQDHEAIDVEYAESAPRSIEQQPASFSESDYPEIAKIDAAESIEELKSLAGEFAARKLGPGKVYDTVNAHYKARLQVLKARDTQPEPPAPSPEAA